MPAQTDIAFAWLRVAEDNAVRKSMRQKLLLERWRLIDGGTTMQTRPSFRTLSFMQAYGGGAEERRQTFDLESMREDHKLRRVGTRGIQAFVSGDQ